ncbi:MAG TPA: sugar kinase [Terriglobales bacterium]|nr:sugar kinase [Terriglobales bacterium]
MSAASKPRFDITIAGELNLDLILYGLPRELPPEREIIARDMALTLGASSAIVAHNLSALGNHVGFISRVGDDSFGQTAIDRLSAAGVDVSRVRRSSDGTGSGLTVILHHGSSRNILTYLGTISQLRYEDLDLDYLCSARHFHLSSFFLQTALRPQVAELFRTLKASGLTISLDTNDDPDDLWEGLREVLPYVDVLLPNEREALKISGEQELETAISRLAEMAPVVVVKLGPKGAIAQRGKERFRSSAVSVDAVDTIGAGDSFDAGFLTQFVRGADLDVCLRFGNVAGALSTTKSGGTEAFLDRAHREQFLRENDSDRQIVQR